MRREDVYLNDLSLRQVDPRIINVVVVEPDAQEDIGYAAFPGRPGQRVIRRQRLSKKIQVQFGIRELYNLARRAEIIDAVNRWAADGALSTTTHPDRIAQVIVTKYAAAADVRDYNGAYSVEFEAAGIPYWQDATPARLDLTGASASGKLLIYGSAETALDADVTPTGDAMTSLTITATSADGGASSMTFSGLSVAVGSTVSLSHDADGMLTLSSGLLAARTAASDDDLLARPGEATIAVTANAAVSATIRARGRWR